MARKSINSRLAKRLFATNEPPSTAEEAALEDIFDAIDNDILKVYQKIVRLKASLQAACEEHAQLLDARAAHRTIMSPVRRLPSDVIFEILQRSRIGLYDESVAVVTLNHREGPWPFMSVCRHWRTVITSHSIFWSNISIPRVPNPSTFSDSLQFILDHSKDALLTIRVSDLATRHLQKEFIRLLAPHSHRWFDLCLDSYHQDLYEDLEKTLSKGSVPQLRRVHLRQLQDLDVPMSWFKAAPNLQTLQIRSKEILPKLRLSWHQIQNLAISNECPLNEVASFLQMMPNLVDCSFVLENDGDAGATIRMPHLRTLKVRVGRRPSVCIISPLDYPRRRKISSWISAVFGSKVQTKSWWPLEASRKPKSSPANPAKQQVLPPPSLQWSCGIDKCTKSFAREADLKRHQKTTKLHSLPGFNCPQCDASFSRADALKRHQRSRHNGLVVDVEETSGDVLQSWGSTPSSSWSSTPPSSSWSSGSSSSSSARSSRERQENEPPDILIVSTSITPPVLTRSISYYRQLAENSAVGASAPKYNLSWASWQEQPAAVAAPQYSSDLPTVRPSPSTEMVSTDEDIEKAMDAAFESFESESWSSENGSETLVDTLCAVLNDDDDGILNHAISVAQVLSQESLAS